VVDADEMMLIKVKMLATKSISERCYLETFEGSWNSWIHDALRLLVRPIAKPKGGVASMDCACEGVYSQVDKHVGNERLLVGVLSRFEWLECC
jgi:hypothetical protein